MRPAFAKVKGDKTREAGAPDSGPGSLTRQGWRTVRR
jgi:hypothetical protein